MDTSLALSMTRQDAIMTNLELANGFWACFAKHFVILSLCKKQKSTKFHFNALLHFNTPFSAIHSPRFENLHNNAKISQAKKTIKQTKNYKKWQKKTI